MIRNRALHVLGFAILAVFIAFVPQTAHAGCVNVFMDPDVTQVTPGQTLEVGLEFSDVLVAEWPIFSFEVEIRYCVGEDQLLDFSSASLGSLLDGLPGNWIVVVAEGSGGTVRIAAAGDTPLIGAGQVAVFEFAVAQNLEPCDGCTIEIVSVSANEASQAVTFCFDPLASHVFVASTKLVGDVIYYNQGRPIERAKVTLNGTADGEPIRRTLLTDESGRYCFDCLPVDIQDVTITVAKTYDQESETSISVTDASAVLRRSVGLAPSPPINIVPVAGACAPNGIAFAEDVSGDGTGSSYDASLILRFIVRAIGTFPVGPEWFFCSDDGVDFVGHLRGDVNGNYGASGVARVAPIASTTLDLEVVDNTVRVVLGNGAAVHAGSLELLVPAGLELSGAYTIDGNLLIASHQEGNRARVAFASAEPIQAGQVLEIAFSGQGDIGLLDVARAQLDDVEVQAQFRQPPAGSNPLPTRFELYGNTPNPFNPKTTISFYLPLEASTSVRVYDQAGRLVRTLSDGENMTGHIAMTWDGTTDGGAPVASGVYYYRVVAGDVSQSGRMVLLK